VSAAGHAASGVAEGRRDWGAFVMKAALIYCAVSLATLPFMNAVWLGELPLLAVPQVPKVELANWLRSDVLIPAAGQLGLSRGSAVVAAVGASFELGKGIDPRPLAR